MSYSVLITVYSKETPENLRRAIISSDEQTLKPKEIILVCDGSLRPELDEEIIKLEKELDSLKVYRLKENRGSGPTSKFGISKCTTEYVARLDSDDYSLPERCEKQLEMLKNDDDLIIVGSNIIEKNSEFTVMKKVPETTEEIRKYSRRRNPFNNPSVMMKKSEILKVGNYRDFRYLEDYDLGMRLIHENSDKKFYNIQEPLVVMTTDARTYLRRGGYLYVKTEFVLQKDFLMKGYISLADFIKNITLRSAVRLLPNSIRRSLYRKRLRDDV